MVHVSGRDGLRVGQAQAVARPRPPVGRAAACALV